MTIAESNAPIPGNIVRILRQKGLLHKAFAKNVGFSSQQFSDMLNGRKLIKPCDILAISGALNIDINELFADTSQGGA